MNGIGLYIHAPFCAYKCPYCDFYSVRPDIDTVKKYTDSVISEIKRYASFTDKTVDTVYFGGGTPTLMEKETVRILDAVIKYFKTDLLEVTVEANPKAELYSLLKYYGSNGVNRISYGAQSAVDTELKALARSHSVNDISRSVEDAIKAGICNISLDMMIGIPLQNSESLQRTVDFYCSLPITHISGYMLKLEEGTHFFKISDKLNLPSDDLTAELYIQMIDFLNKNGFIQYEISNFAKSGFESVHNTKYWILDEYIGIGPSAHSFFNGKRFYYPRSLEDFISCPQTVPDGFGGDDFEKIMLGLRMNKGVPLNSLSNRSRDVLLNNLKSATAEYAQEKNGCICLTKHGFLLSNSVIALLTQGI